MWLTFTEYSKPPPYFNLKFNLNWLSTFSPGPKIPIQNYHISIGTKSVKMSLFQTLSGQYGAEIISLECYF
jgi:hypothetical protein